MIEPHSRLSLVRQCERFQINRTSVYYRLQPVRNIGPDYFDELRERVIHSVIPASSSAPSSVIPAYSFVIPAQAGIQKVLKA